MNLLQVHRTYHMATVIPEPQEGVYVPGYGNIPTDVEIQQLYNNIEALASELGQAARKILQEVRQVMDRYNSGYIK